MKKPFVSYETCSVARTLETVGDWWTLLIIKEAFSGTRRFSEFENYLGIAKNVLSDRLSKLVQAGVLERTPVVGRGNPQDYTLTEKGQDLLAVLLALQQWGDRWIHGPDKAPTLVIDRSNGQEIPPIQVLSRDGRVLSGKDLVIVPGPGADEALIERYGKNSERVS